ncbi:MAG: ABC transporter substrate-binding protein [Candidatus Paceibacterota bacterium]
MLRNILLGAGVFAALFSILIFSGKLPIGQGEAKAKGEVALWGTLPEQQMNKVVQEFNPKAGSYRVTYREISEEQFSQTLLEALANGTAPDLIIAPHQIILANQSRLYPFPLASFSEKSYKDTYVDGAGIFFTSQGALALPVSVDPLVLFYNRSLFSKHGIVDPPTYWDEVASRVPLLTLRDAKGGFVESAIALGAPNVSYIKDILMATVGELGQSPVLTQTRADGVPVITVTANTPVVNLPDVLPLSTAVMFFTQFSDPAKSTYTWSQYASKPDDAFVAEKLAMYIGYASELATLRARNPNGDFEMAYLPQTRGYNTFVTGGQMYGIATLKTTKNPLTSFTVEGQFAGSGVSPAIAAAIGATPALRAYSTTTGLSDVIARSMLVVKPWYDIYPAQSTQLVATMLLDVISGRLGPADAAGAFVSRLQDLYTPL